MSFPGITLRPATREDYDFLYRLHRQAFQEWVEAAWGWDEARQEALFRDEFDIPERTVICINGQPVGSIVVEDHGDFLYLDYLALLPSHQRRGLGAALMIDLMAKAEQLCKPVQLHVLKSNPARRLYERLGFRITGEDPYRYFMEWRGGSFDEPDGKD